MERWWDVWTNQAELRPKQEALLLDWARWWDYDGGGVSFGVTGWGAHSYDQINRALGTDDTGPTEVVLEEPVAHRAICTGPDQYRQGHLAGPRTKVTMKFASGTKVNLHLDYGWGPGLGATFVGQRGKIEINRDKVASNPAELVRSPNNPGPVKNLNTSTSYHIKNWVDCIKNRKPCNADIEIGQRSSTLCCLVNIVRDIGRVGEPLRWDPVTERFTNCDEANRFLSPAAQGIRIAGDWVSQAEQNNG